MQHQPYPEALQRRNPRGGHHAHRHDRVPPLSRGANIALIVLGVIAVGVALRLAGDIFIPLVGALIAALILGPISDALGRARVPPAVTALGLMLMVMLVVVAISAGVSAPLASWIDRAPEIGETLRQRLSFLIEPLQAAERLQDLFKSALGGARGALSVELAQPGVGASLVTTLSPALGQLLVFFGMLFFFLLGRERLRREVVLAFRGRKHRLAAMHTIAGIQYDLGIYLGTIAAINFCLGVVVGIGMALIGMPNPFLWGMLTFVLNFVPFVGTVLMVALTTVGGLVSFEPVFWGLMPLAIYLTCHLIESQFITPTLLGSRFAVNPLFVFLAIVFWTWLWGPVGALLAAPILVIATSIWTAMNTKKQPSLP
jgi:predicted PurR-regulated permease PerM